MKKARLYRDYFLHFDIFVMSVLCLVLIAITIMNGLSWSDIFYVGVGLVVFMFSEYVTHRFLFHLKAPKNPFFLKILKRLHYDHHKYPNDLKLLFLPVWYSLPNLFLLALLFYILTSNFYGAVAFSVGLIVMLLVYEWKHYIAHRPIQPVSKFGKWLKKLHLLHHFKNENYWYGVSTPFIDVLFGTLKKEQEVETSTTTKSLEERHVKKASS